MASQSTVAQRHEGNGGADSSNLLLSMTDFTDVKQIGKGKDSVVYSATCPKLGGLSVVLKVYDKMKISAVKHRSVRREARIMKYLTHKGVPHVTEFIGAFQDSQQMYIVMEHAGGGDLLEQLLKEGRAMIERRTVREVVVPIVASLVHLHCLGIIHRDIKLENIFIDNAGCIQLGDFGLAVCVAEERPISPVGTLEYMPPEILRLPTTELIVSGQICADDVEPVDEKVDVWSFGITVYELVTGRSPFEGRNKDEIRRAILQHDMRPLPAFLSLECCDFINKSLSPDPNMRPSVRSLLQHPWVRAHTSSQEVAQALAQVARTPYITCPASGRPAAATPQVGAVAAQAAVGQGAAAAAATDGKPRTKVAPPAPQSPSSPVSEGIPAYVPPQPQAVGRSPSGTSTSSSSPITGDGHRTSSSATGSVASTVTSVADSAASLGGGGGGGGACGRGAKHPPHRQTTIEESLAEEIEPADYRPGGGMPGAGHAVQCKPKQGSPSKLGKWMCMFNVEAST